MTEISQIILVLLDSRCPTVHFPPSLVSFITGSHPILVLTKADIAGPQRIAAWKTLLMQQHPGIPIVETESYVEKTYSEDKQGRPMYEPTMPTRFKERLVATLQQVHATMLDPPQHIKGDPARLKNWKPTVKKDINWSHLLNAKGSQVGQVVEGATAPKTSLESGEEEPEFFTIGLIGKRVQHTSLQ